MKKKTIHCFLDKQHLGSFTLQPQKKALKETFDDVKAFLEVAIEREEGSYQFIKEFAKDNKDLLLKWMTTYAYVYSGAHSPKTTKMAMNWTSKPEDPKVLEIEIHETIK